MPYQQTDVAGVLATNLELFRTERGWTQAALAERMADLGMPVHPTWVTRVEKGTRRVTVTEWLVLAAALQISPAALLFRIDGGDLELTPGHRSIRQPEAEDWFAGIAPLMEPADPWPMEWWRPNGSPRERRIRRVPRLHMLLAKTYALADALTLADPANPDDTWTDIAKSTGASIRRSIARLLDDLSEGTL